MYNRKIPANIIYECHTILRDIVVALRIIRDNPNNKHAKKYLEWTTSEGVQEILYPLEITTLPYNHPDIIRVDGLPLTMDGKNPFGIEPKTNSSDGRYGALSEHLVGLIKEQFPNSSLEAKTLKT